MEGAAPGFENATETLQLLLRVLNGDDSAIAHGVSLQNGTQYHARGLSSQQVSRLVREQSAPSPNASPQKNGSPDSRLGPVNFGNESGASGALNARNSALPHMEAPAHVREAPRNSPYQQVRNRPDVAQRSFPMSRPQETLTETASRRLSHDPSSSNLRHQPEIVGSREPRAMRNSSQKNQGSSVFQRSGSNMFNGGDRDMRGHGELRTLREGGQASFPQEDMLFSNDLLDGSNGSQYGSRNMHASKTAASWYPSDLRDGNHGGPYGSRSMPASKTAHSWSSSDLRDGSHGGQYVSRNMPASNAAASWSSNDQRHVTNSGLYGSRSMRPSQTTTSLSSNDERGGSNLGQYGSRNMPASQTTASWYPSDLQDGSDGGPYGSRSIRASKTTTSWSSSDLRDGGDGGQRVSRNMPALKTATSRSASDVRVGGDGGPYGLRNMRASQTTSSWSSLQKGVPNNLQQSGSEILMRRSANQLSLNASSKSLAAADVSPLDAHIDNVISASRTAAVHSNEAADEAEILARAAKRAANRCNYLADLSDAATDAAIQAAKAKEAADEYNKLVTMMPADTLRPPVTLVYSEYEEAPAQSALTQQGYVASAAEPVMDMQSMQKPEVTVRDMQSMQKPQAAASNGQNPHKPEARVREVQSPRKPEAPVRNVVQKPRKPDDPAQSMQNLQKPEKPRKPDAPAQNIHNLQKPEAPARDVQSSEKPEAPVSDAQPQIHRSLTSLLFPTEPKSGLSESESDEESDDSAREDDSNEGDTSDEGEDVADMEGIHGAQLLEPVTLPVFQEICSSLDMNEDEARSIYERECEALEQQGQKVDREKGVPLAEFIDDLHIEPRDSEGIEFLLHASQKAKDGSLSRSNSRRAVKPGGKQVVENSMFDKLLRKVASKNIPPQDAYKMLERADRFMSKTEVETLERYAVMPRELTKIVERLRIDPPIMNATAGQASCKEICIREVTRIIEECKAAGTKYTDPDWDIKANPSKVLYVDTEGPGYDCTVGEPAKFRRLSTIVKNSTKSGLGSLFAGLGGSNKRRDLKPMVFKGTVAAGDIIQGQIGTCFLLGAISSIASQREASFAKVFVKYDVDVGVYGVRFYVNGEWMHVIVDDWMPVDQGGNLLYARCKDPQEVWVPVLEKAYCKLYQCYEMCDGGDAPEAILTLFGGVSGKMVIKEEHRKNPKLYFKALRNAFNKGWLLTTSFVPHPGAKGGGQGKCGEAMLPSGLVGGHAYSVLQFVEASGHQLICCRNPWGSGEWTGKWSDRNAFGEWTDEMKVAANWAKRDDGKFWMSIEDFVANSGGVDYARTFGPDWKKLSHYRYFQNKAYTATAKRKYNARRAEQLSFNKGDQVTIKNMDNDEWWQGQIEGAHASGCFPARFVRLNERPVLRFDLSPVPDEGSRHPIKIIVVLMQANSMLYRKYVQLENGMNYKDLSYPQVGLLIMDPEGKVQLSKKKHSRYVWGEITCRGGGLWKVYAYSSTGRGDRCLIRTYIKGGTAHLREIPNCCISEIASFLAN